MHCIIKTLRHKAWDVKVHYATHDTRLTHGHRKLRLAEDFEILKLILKYCVWRVILKHCTWRPPDARQTPARRILKSGVRRYISKSCVFCDLPPIRVIPSCWQVNWNATENLDALANTIWLFFHAGTGPPIQTIWLFLHASTRPLTQTTWFLL